MELVRQDEADPMRGPVRRRVQAVYEAAYRAGNESPFFREFQEFQFAFRDHFGQEEALRYRLFHLIIGSGPMGSADLFDAEGEWSIAAKTEELAQKYGVALPQE